MALVLWYHPYAAYGQKAAVALYELGLPFERRIVEGQDEALMAEFQRLSPFAKMPALVNGDDGQVVYESSIVIEWLDHHGGGDRLIPADPDSALEVRLVDRVLDTYVGSPMNRIVFEKFRPEESRDPFGSLADGQVLTQAWDWLEDRLGDGREWGAGPTFSMADCAAAPLLTYARRLVPFGDRPRLREWHGRLMQRPSFQQVLRDADPYGDMMPAPPAKD